MQIGFRQPLEEGETDYTAFRSLNDEAIAAITASAANSSITSRTALRSTCSLTPNVRPCTPLPSSSTSAR